MRVTHDWEGTRAVIRVEGLQQSAKALHLGDLHMAVVDAQMQVRGIDNLRVVYASVMPDIVSGNLNAPTQMIAERATDYLL